MTISPYDLFQVWFADAKSAEINDPDAACLATVDEAGMPNARVVLIRKVDERGFCFFTNYESQKGRELLTGKKAAINFHWKSLRRQIRIRGDVSPVSREESDSYYASRPLGNRIGAWASLQSQPLADRQILIDRVAMYEHQFGDTPTRPEHWGGFRIIPSSIEFWQEADFRLHDRTRYERDGDTWVTTKLFP